jgi:hypothetical protein
VQEIKRDVKFLTRYEKAKKELGRENRSWQDIVKQFVAFAAVRRKSCS